MFFLFYSRILTDTMILCDSIPGDNLDEAKQHAIDASAAAEKVSFFWSIGNRREMGEVQE